MILRKVVSRTQDFRSTVDYPHGFIVEKLECGHERIESINEEEAFVYDEEDSYLEEIVRERAVDDIAFPRSRHQPQANRRRCAECAKTRK